MKFHYFASNDFKQLLQRFATCATLLTDSNECAAESERQELRAGHPIVAYVSNERAHAHGPYKLTTWPGEFLGWVGVTERPGARKRYVAGTVAGLAVYGSGPLENGDYVTLHPCKVAK